MRVTMEFPGTNYSQNKAEIAKFRKIVGCGEKGCWTGSSWEGKLLTIETDFAKAASNTPRDYDGDILILDGNADLCGILTDMAKDWGANVVKDGVSRSKRIHRYRPVDASAAINVFRNKAQGLSESFKVKWEILMQNAAEVNGVIVT